MVAGQQIVFVYSGFLKTVGGPVTHMRELARSLAALGHPVRILSLDDVWPGARYLPHLFQRAGNRLASPAGYYLRYWTGARLLRRKVAQLIERGDVGGVVFQDIYLAHPVPVPALAMLHALQSDNLHDDIVSPAGHATARRYEAALLRRLSVPVYTVSEAYRSFIAGFLGDPTLEQRLGVLPLGVDLRPFPDPPRARRPAPPLRAISVGYLIARKNTAFLLDVAASMSELTIDVFGGGPLRAPLERNVAERGLGDRVRFCGAVEHTELVERLQDYHVMLHPSIKESFSLALCEGKLAGLHTIVEKSLEVPDEFCDERLPLAVETWVSTIRRVQSNLQTGSNARQLAGIARVRARFSSASAAQALVDALR